MKDLFTCPEAVMKFLCAQYKVFQIPVGDNRTKDMVDQITQEVPELRCFYTAANSVSEPLLPGPSCSKLTTSLVSVSLKFQTLILQIHCYFLLKKCENPLHCKGFSHFFNKK